MYKLEKYFINNDIIHVVKVPYYQSAIISDIKLTEYLLSLTHPVGKFKAKLFRGWGFNENNIDIFRKCLLSIVHTNKVVKIKTSQHSTNYEVHGKIQIPKGGVRIITTVWAIDIGKRTPYLVSAYKV